MLFFNDKLLKGDFMTKWDKLLIIIVLLSSLTAMYFIKNQALNYDNDYVVITVNNEVYKTYSLDEKVEAEVVVDSDYGRNVVHVEHGYAYMHDSDCPDKICIMQGRISKPGEIIVCLPNRLIIEVKGKNEDLDTISH
jgi:hypothetical protein